MNIPCTLSYLPICIGEASHNKRALNLANRYNFVNVVMATLILIITL